MRLQDFYPIVVTEELTGCRDFYRRWFGLEVVFEASWFVLLGTGAGGRAIVAFMHPSHPSAPSGPEPFSGKGMCLEFQVADARTEHARFVRDGAPVTLSLRDEPFGQRRFGLFDPGSGSTWWSRSSRRPGGGASISRGMDHEARLARALQSLEGLSVGDAFGEEFFTEPSTFMARLDGRVLPAAPWAYTDDTVMALSIVETLQEHGGIHQDSLAARFGRKFGLDPWPGYGRVTHQILSEIVRGRDWRDLSAGAFGGSGSMGNGGAMRAGPIGAYFAGDLRTAAAQARLAAEVTHAHAEEQAGAPDPPGLFGAVLEVVPRGETHDAIELASAIDGNADVLTAVSLVGNGLPTLAQDTVPFALWCVRHHLDDYVSALWTAAAAFGDCDTLCAIVGSIVALNEGGSGIPEEWRRRREPLSTFSRFG
jgi:ADP-ribosylglycohydrolase